MSLVLCSVDLGPCSRVRCTYTPSAFRETGKGTAFGDQRFVLLVSVPQTIRSSRISGFNKEIFIPTCFVAVISEIWSRFIMVLAVGSVGSITPLQNNPLKCTHTQVPGSRGGGAEAPLENSR